jgi:predicted AlkP superfamily pyrophosphatase or phosphodiesterase
VLRASRLARLALAFALALCAAAPAGAEERPVVILLSLDGTRHDYPERVKTIALARMQREGARAARLTPVFPSSTFPNHVSLATGTYVDRHGIIANSFKDRSGRKFDYSNDASWIEAEPLWITAERQGVRAATFFWVGSETEWRGRAATHRVKPFDASVGEAAKVDQILAWLDLPAKERPGLIMSWWHGCDHVGHEEGPNSPNIAVQLAAQDAQLARLFAALDERKAWSNTTVIVASDHGMSEVTGLADGSGPLASGSIRARSEFSGGDGQIYLDTPSQREAALASFAKSAEIRAYTPESLPPAYRSFFAGRSGDLTLVTAPPLVLGRPSAAQKALAPVNRMLGRVRGAHGFDPDHPDMGAIFFALGRGVPAGTQLGTVRAIDVAPTAAALLGIEPPAQSEGRALFQTASNSEAKPCPPPTHIVTRP